MGGSMTKTCPTCGQKVPAPRPDISDRAGLTLAYMQKEAPKRGGYMFEGARPSFEKGTYHDADISELLKHGLIAPHEDPAKGWVVVE